MDEPTSGLDPNQIHDVRLLIRRLGETKTILISTHILQEVTAVCDHVILINEGRVVFDGTPLEMAAGGSLEDAFHRLTTAGVAVEPLATASVPAEESGGFLQSEGGSLDPGARTPVDSRAAEPLAGPSSEAPDRADPSGETRSTATSTQQHSTGGER
jgi:ABC-type multidrug transport system ATPase subunit